MTLMITELYMYPELGTRAAIGFLYYLSGSNVVLVSESESVL